MLQPQSVVPVLLAERNHLHCQLPRELLLSLVPPENKLLLSNHGQ